MLKYTQKQLAEILKWKLKVIHLKQLRILVN